MPIILGLVMFNFFLYPHGPLTWLFDQLYNWWASVLGIDSAGGSRPHHVGGPGVGRRRDLVCVRRAHGPGTAWT